MLFKNPISPLLLFLSLLGLLILGSCEKDSFLPNPVEDVAFNSMSELKQQTKMNHVVASEDLQQSIKASLLSNSGKPDKGKEDDAAFSAILDTILASPASKTSSDTLDYDVYSYFVPTEDPTYVVNAVFSAKDDALTGGYVNIFRMTSSFATSFNSFSVDFSQFEGELGIRPLSSLKELIYKSGQKNGDGDCFTYILSLEPTKPDGGGSGGGDVSGDGPTISTTGPVGGGGAGDGGARCLVFTFLPCTCSPNHQVGHNGEECKCGDLGGGGEHPRLEITECNPNQTFSPDTTPTTSSTNKDLNLEDCTKLLASVGIVPRRLSPSDASELTLAQLSAAIKKGGVSNVRVTIP